MTILRPQREYWAMNGILTILFVGLMYILFLQIYPSTVFEFVTPVKPLGVWKAGGPIQYQMDVHKKESLPAHSLTYLKNEKFTVHVDNHPSNYPVGRRTSISIGDLDPDTPPGKYDFCWSGTWHVNWLRDDTVNSCSVEKIEVLPGDRR